MKQPHLINVLQRLQSAARGLAQQLRPLALFNLAVPRGSYRRHVDLAYGELARQRSDIYLPTKSAADRPVVVFFYGGSWQRGRRQDYRFVGQTLAARGWVTIIPDYRLYPEVKFPGFIEDAAAACGWVRKHIAGYGGNQDRLFVMGHSAGAYIAAMLALDDRYLGRVGLAPQELHGFIGLAGPYDFLPLRQPDLIDIFGGTDNMPETQPINFVSAAAPPALLLHGASDRIVGVANTQRLAQRWRQQGRPVWEIIYPHYNHLTILLYLASFLAAGEPLRQDISRFLAHYGCAPRALGVRFGVTEPATRNSACCPS
ncbi:MAG: alpha/beta hydrolase [Desulfobacca sp.]|uniref:alpha/beta hydrolase n=1 Tax=Desulfobacca sp. TaxID=2067990 RepID=UPI0040490E4A